MNKNVLGISQKFVENTFCNFDEKHFSENPSRIFPNRLTRQFIIAVKNVLLVVS